VISQIFGGGGNSGAPLRNDFIEIFNSGTTTINLSGWSVQYASATASTWSVTTLPNVSVESGQYLLIQEGSGGANGANLSTPDVTGSINLAATAGKVALVNTTSALIGACPNITGIIDLVGYGSTASCFRGTGPAPAPANATAVVRNSNGCDNAQNNASDFVVAAPNPRNRSAPLSPCQTALGIFGGNENQWPRWVIPPQLRDIGWMRSCNSSYAPSHSPNLSDTHLIRSSAKTIDPIEIEVVRFTWSESHS
jgi:hypothetical protein